MDTHRDVGPPQKQAGYVFGLAIALLIFSITLRGASAPTAGLVGYWNFDEAGGTTVLDGSGLANNGTLSGAGVTRVAGKVGSGALKFDGISGKVTIPGTSSLNQTSSFTLTAWLRVAAFTATYQTPLIKGTTSACAYWLQMAGTHPSIGFGAGTTSNCSSYREHVVSNVTWQQDVWHHAAVVFDDASNTFAFFLDGTRVFIISQTSAPLSSAEALVFGQSTNAGDNYERMNGQIDEVRIYNRALSAQEVLDVFGDTGSSSSTDVQPPTVPTNVSAAAASTTQINLSWTASTDNSGVAGYRVYRSGTQIGASISTSYSDTGLQPGTSYSYTVAAYDYVQNTSAQSSPPATATTFPSAGGGSPPSVSMTSPASNAIVRGTFVSVDASASDNVGVVGVQFLLDGNSLGAEDTASPFHTTWNSTQTADGGHVLSARARDAAGNRTTSAPVIVRVDNLPPTGTISINGGASGTNSAAVTLAVSATDAGSSVTSMRFANSGGSFSASQPYATTASWTLTSGSGSKTVLVQFRDASFNWSQSFQSTIVYDPDPPSISFSQPNNGASVAGSVTVAASASDSVGVASVQFYLDGNAIGSQDTTTPYQTTWDATTASNGAHTLAATARDAAGNAASASISVTVANGASSGGGVYPLRLSGDGRSLVDQAGQPFFINGDTAWSLIAQLTREDADVYLSDREQKGFNLVMVNLIEHRFASQAPANIYNNSPFSPAGNLAAPNEAYFAHADYVVRKAAEKGIIVLLAPLYLGGGCNSEGWCTEVRNSSSSTMRAWGRYVGNRYKTFPNIIWLIGGDTDPVASGVGSQVLDFVAGLREYDTTHLMTAHNASEQSARDVWNGQSWLNINDVYTYQSTSSKALSQYNRSPFMPLFLIESAYENEHSSTPQSLRNQAYSAILSGATLGHIFGNCPIWAFGAAPSFCTPTNWQQQLNSTGSRTLAYVGQLFTSRAFTQLRPDQSHTVMTAGYEFGSTYASTSRTADGNTVIAYLPTRRTVTIDLTRVTGSLARAWWFNPGTTQATLIGDFPTTGTRTFTPPVDGDWVLVVDNADLGLSAPGN
jgi:chitodextrinase